MSKKQTIADKISALTAKVSLNAPGSLRSDEKVKNKSVYRKNGGARPGAGRPKGSTNKETRDRRDAEKEMVDKILRKMMPILDSQIAAAQGLSYVYRIDEELDSKGHVKKREHVLVTDPDEIRQVLDQTEGGSGTVDDTYYYITVKAPDNKAADSLLDRAFGKAPQRIVGDEEQPICIKLDL